MRSNFLLWGFDNLIVFFFFLVNEFFVAYFNEKSVLLKCVNDENIFFNLKMGVNMISYSFVLTLMLHHQIE